MTLLKHAQAERMTSRAVTPALADVDRPAVVRAVPSAPTKSVAPRERSITRRAAARARTRGYDEGYAQGLRDGRRAAAARDVRKIETLLASIAAANAHFETERHALLEDAKADVLALALEVAERLVHRVIEVDPSTVLDQLEAALDLVITPGLVEARVHPDDLEIVEAARGRLDQRLRRDVKLTVRDDPNVDRGGCVLSCAVGEIDARIGTQIEQLAEAMVPE